MSHSNHLSPEQRRSALLSNSAEVLADLPHSFGTQSFIISEQEATRIGEAVNARDHRSIEDTIGTVMNAAVEDYTSTEANECIGVWDGAFSAIFGEGITTADLLTSPETRDLLNASLVHSEVSQLGMETTEYLKLVESIAILTMPDKGFRNPPDSRRTRTGGSDSALFGRSVRLLDALASMEPGIRTMRKDILDNDPGALNKYLASLMRARSAQDSLAKIIELDEHEIRRQKAGLIMTIHNNPTNQEIETEDLLHVLEWKLLDGSEDRDTRHKQIKKIIEGQSKTERQRRQLAHEWCPERLDFLIEIAQLAQENNRHPSMFISNRFEEGAGVYVALELDNPYDSTKKILFADNPIAGNALYIVDEVKLENEGRPNEWQNVLGANRRMARERGAFRKYHTKNWQSIIDTILAMGEAPNPPKVSAECEPVFHFLELKKRSDALMRAAENLLS